MNPETPAGQLDDVIDAGGAKAVAVTLVAQGNDLCTRMTVSRKANGRRELCRSARTQDEDSRGRARGKRRCDIEC